MNQGWLPPVPQGWIEGVEAELRYDIGAGDFSAACLAQNQRVDFRVEAQATGIVCGVGIALTVLGLDQDITFHINDGDQVQNKTRILSGNLPVQHLLSHERTTLNYLTHLSGISTLTKRFVDAVEGTGCRILDTRKTIPGLRILQKYAVRCGGGQNHRLGLSDGIMLKDNHICAAGSIKEAVKRARQIATHMTKIEVECESAEMVDQAIDAGADIIMLDNMPIELMAAIVKKHHGQAILEASGGVTLETVRSIAETGVDAVSVGALTHSAPALNLHLEIE